MKAHLSLLAIAALAGCQASEPTMTGDLSNDALPSAQVTAFQQVDARLGYDNARIEYDENECATYSATGPTGEPYSEVLADASGDPICVD